LRLLRASIVQSRILMYVALSRAGFRRYATYRQATVAGAFTNVVFGFLRGYALFAAVAGAGGAVAGYDLERLATFVWASQGMLAVVNLWGVPEHAERIRTGEAVADLLRPVDPIWYLLAVDSGRVGFALLTRFAIPVLVGAVTFDLYAPRRWSTYPLFAVSLVLAVVVTFACRHVVFSSVHWLLDVRGPQVAWTLFSGVLSGLFFPLWFLPGPVATALAYGTPFPSIIQAPMDVLVERGSAARLIVVQAAWAVAAVAAARAVQRRAERKMVVQGG
jgi:ABC-2 type transport system permease protein